ncbi:hypothetical protein [Solibacillus sp. CAU 1738]|uniref:hypothetical protein n=1 Tax=Solibacillus sp. CAU 1738 TaxID=3140363 RepID=UPI003260EB5B
MKIQQSFKLPNNVLPKDENKLTEQKESNTMQLPTKDEQAKQARDIVLSQLSEMQEAQMKTGEGNPKAERILNKFNSGKKLSSEELSYLIKYAPASVERVLRITAEREQTEMMMRASKTKTGVQFIAMQAANTIEKSSENVQDQQAQMSHLQDAKTEYEKTDDYKEKLNFELERDNNRERKKSTAYPQSNVLWATAQLAYKRRHIKE